MVEDERERKQWGREERERRKKKCIIYSGVCIVFNILCSLIIALNRGGNRPGRPSGAYGSAY